MGNKAEARIKIDKQHEKSDNCKYLVAYNPLKRCNILKISPLIYISIFN